MFCGTGKDDFDDLTLMIVFLELMLDVVLLVDDATVPGFFFEEIDVAFVTDVSPEDVFVVVLVAIVTGLSSFFSVAFKFGSEEDLVFKLGVLDTVGRLLLIFVMVTDGSLSLV